MSVKNGSEGPRGRRPQSRELLAWFLAANPGQQFAGLFRAHRLIAVVWLDCLFCVGFALPNSRISQKGGNFG